MEIKYINNEKEIGIEYDLKVIKRVYDRLKVYEE